MAGPVLQTLGILVALVSSAPTPTTNVMTTNTESVTDSVHKSSGQCQIGDAVGSTVRPTTGTACPSAGCTGTWGTCCGSQNYCAGATGDFGGCCCLSEQYLVATTAGDYACHFRTRGDWCKGDFECPNGDGTGESLYCYIFNERSEYNADKDEDPQGLCCGDNEVMVAVTEGFMSVNIVTRYECAPRS